MKLFGKTYSREQLAKLTGKLNQIGGTRHYTLNNGTANGIRAVDINTGSGLVYSVLLDRGMDISLASFKGRNLPYLTCSGEVHPAFYEPEGFGWLRTFGGGLLTTCGLTYIGHPGKDGNDDLGLHGRYSTIPAQQVCDLSCWHKDKYVIRLSGIMEECSLFGHKLRLTRTLSSTLGESSILIEDSVENFGFKPSPFTILYHFNLGFPLLDADSTLRVSADKSEPGNEQAKRGVADMFKLTQPTPGFEEQVFTHTFRPNAKGGACAVLTNPQLDGGLALSLRLSSKELPYLTEWKMMGEGEYVLGLEPCNVPCMNRSILRKRKILPMLAPGEVKVFSIQLDILEGQKNIQSFLKSQSV